MNKLGIVALSAVLALGLASAPGFAAGKKGFEAPPPIKYTINVGVGEKQVVAVNVQGSAGVTVDAPNGGKIVIAGASLHQKVGEAVSQGAKMVGGKLDTTRHRIKVKLVTGGKTLTRTALLCSDQPGAAFYADFGNNGQAFLCTSAAQ